MRQRTAWVAAAFALLAGSAPFQQARAQGEDGIIGGTTRVADDSAALPAGGASLVAGDPVQSLKLGGSGAADAQVSVVSVTDKKLPFTQAQRVVTTTKTGENDATLFAPIVAPVREVDTVHIR